MAEQVNAEVGLAKFNIDECEQKDLDVQNKNTKNNEIKATYSRLTYHHLALMTPTSLHLPNLS